MRRRFAAGNAGGRILKDVMQVAAQRKKLNLTYSAGKYDISVQSAPHNHAFETCLASGKSNAKSAPGIE